MNGRALISPAPGARLVAGSDAASDGLRQERRLVVAAFLSLFGVLCAQTLMETARDALFLSRIPISRLPWVYLALAGLTLLATSVSPRQRRRRGERAAPLSLFIGATVTAAIGVALTGGGRIAIYSLFLWSGIFATFTVTKIWTILAERLDLSLAKRIYGRLAAGGGLGAVVGAALARLLSERIAPHGLVWLAAAILAATAVGPALALGALAPSGGATAEPRVPGSSSWRRSSRSVEHPYVRRLLLAALLAAAVSTLVDFSFKEAVAARLAPERLPAFFATFHLVISAVSLLAQLCGVGLLVRLTGVGRAPIVLPGLLLLGVASTALTGGLAGVLLLRGLDAAVRSSFHRPVFELLQVPLGDRLRRRAKPLIDALGLLLMVRTAAGPGVRLAVVAVLLLIWWAVAFGLGRRYVDLLRSMLHRLGPTPPPREAAPLPAQVPIDAAPAAGPLLDRLLVEEDAGARVDLLRALDGVRRAGPEVELDEDILGRAATAEVRSARRYLAWRLFLEDGAARLPARRTPTWERLRACLAEMEENAVERLFLVLTLRYPREDFRGLLLALHANERRTRSAGRELIENLLGGPARALTLALVDDAGDRERLAALAHGRPPQALRYCELVAAIRTEEAGGTLAQLAAWHAAELGAPARFIEPMAAESGAEKCEIAAMTTIAAAAHA